jgi:8-oxo-dGTP pyrophosphatase MutT (NUDIX family)
MTDEARHLLDLLDRYRPSGSAEVADVARLRRATDGDLWSRAEPLHVTGSALVVHEASRRVLLRWHDRMQAWMQVGGHFDPGESDPLLVALREAEEETGLSDLTVAPGTRGQPVQIVIVPVAAGRGEPAHEHADIRYVLATATPEAAVPESEGAHVRWLGFDEAFASVREDNLRELLQRAANALNWREA